MVFSKPEVLQDFLQIFLLMDFMTRTINSLHMLHFTINEFRYEFMVPDVSQDS